MKSKSAQRQAIEYFEKKQNERKIADNMAECQMYRFAIEALQEKEERNKRGNRDSEICSQLEKLIDKYNEYIRHYESLEELDEYDQGKYDDLICNVANLKDILNSNSDAHIPTEVIDEMRELRNNFKHISLENVNAALKNLTRMEKDALLQLYVYGEREDQLSGLSRARNKYMTFYYSVLLSRNNKKGYVLSECRCIVEEY